MDLRPYVDNVRRELAIAAEAGGEDARTLAERLSAPLASTIKMTLLDALSAAADEITRDLAPGSVEVRLRAGDASFAVTLPVVEPSTPAGTDYPTPHTPDPDEPTADDDSAMTRINFRLPEHLKARLEEAAAAEGRSVNAWLLRATSAALRGPSGTTPLPPPPGGSGRTSQRYTGWVS
jgi:hypothetical protein